MTRQARILAVAAFTAALTLAGLWTPATATSADLQDLWFPPVTYSHEAQTISGRVELTATAYQEPIDGTDTGWEITVEASDLQYAGRHQGQTLPAGHLALASIEPPTVVDQVSEPAISGAGPHAPGGPNAGPLDRPRTVLHAAPGFARGTYVQGLTLTLTLPAGAREGTYTGSITTTISPGLEAIIETEPGPGPTEEPATDEPTTEEPAPTTEETTEAEPTTEPSPEPEPEPEPTTEETTAAEPTATETLEPEPEPEPTSEETTTPTP